MQRDLLGPLSAVRSLTGIDAVQAAQLEALGFALDTVVSVYGRLANALELGAPESTEVVFADAWAIIDWMNRLHRLVSSCRGLPNDAIPVKEFKMTSSLVENLRHLFQHPEAEIAAVSASRRSPWGHLAWQRRHDGGHEVVVITPSGRWDEGEFRLPDDFAASPRSAVDRVSLFSPDGAVEIGLTGQCEAAARFARQLDAAVHVAQADAEPGEILRLRTWLPGAD